MHIQHYREMDLSPRALSPGATHPRLLSTDLNQPQIWKLPAAISDHFYEMSFSHRRYIAGQLYELCFKVRKGIPFPPKKVIKAIIQSALARTQRDEKVHICHDLWMGNHDHMLAIFKDADAAKCFYAEVMKKITDYIKALLGIEQLNLWQNRPNVSHIPDIETAITRIAYIYNNPSRADLVDSIEEYPGISTYQVFKSASNDVRAQVTTEIPWIRLPTIEKLHSAALSDQSDAFIANKLLSEAKKKHALTIEPNLWMLCFKVYKEEDVKEVNDKIFRQIKGMESNYRAIREKDGKRVIGVRRLRAQAIMREYTPKRSREDRRVPIICIHKELRIALIREFQHFCALCRARYLEWKDGDFSSPWPPGGFRPPMPPLANAI